MLSQKIGEGIQIFRIRNFKELFTEIMDLGSDYSNHINSKKILKLIKEEKYYAYVEIPYKDLESFIIKIDKNDIKNINWIKIANIADNCRYKGQKSSNYYIN